MLSSGTLNLKFMQRGKTPQTIQSNHSRQRSLGQKSSPGPDVKSNSKDGRLKDSYNSKHSDQRQDQAPEIVYEDSLISFPLLSFSSSSSASTKSLRTKNLSNCLTVVPHHVGRRSYGEFNKTVEKLGLLSTDNLKDQKTAKREAELGTSSKPKRTDQSNKATKRSSKPIQSQYDHSSKPLDALTTTNHSIVSTNNGFVKPFSLISVQNQTSSSSKNKNNKRNLNEQSTDIRSTKSSKKRSKLSDDSQGSDQLDFIINPRPKKRSIEKSLEEGFSDIDEEESDDEMVNQKIEKMFLEARQMY